MLEVVSTNEYIKKKFSFIHTHGNKYSLIEVPEISDDENIINTRVLKFEDGYFWKETLTLTYQTHELDTENGKVSVKLPVLETKFFFGSEKVENWKQYVTYEITGGIKA